MQLSVFSLRLDRDRGVFDDTALRSFLADKRVVEVRAHFTAVASEPLWAVMVLWQAREPADVPAAAASGKRVTQDWRATLMAEDAALFDALRAWRNRRAKAGGVPAFVLLTNRTLAELVRRKPRTRAALLEVRGIGPKGVASWGDEALAVVADHLPSSGAQPRPETVGEGAGEP